MKIGILTYHWVANFGANLQTLSTVNYLKKNGHKPYVINWIPEDLERIYKTNTNKHQLDEHLKFNETYLELTAVCRNEKDIVNEIKKLSLDLIIIGSDAVLTYKPFLQRYILSRKGILYFKPAIDSDFPNPFWGNFIKHIPNIPVALMSASAQNTDYSLIYSIKRKGEFKNALQRFSYISVRDIWTKKMIQYLTNYSICPNITPDPVFAFNYNHIDYITKQEILKKFNLPDKYVLISTNNKNINASWLYEIENLFKMEKISLVELPRPQGSPDLYINNKINLPLSPIEWYYLIKYSNGYIGELMHPVLVSLHNKVPVFAIDDYGFTKKRKFNSDSSKTYQIMNRFKLIEKNYYSVSTNKFPSPSIVFNSIIHFDKLNCDLHAKNLYSDYKQMMNTILNLV